MEKVRPEQLCVRIFVGTIQEDTMTCPCHRKAPGLSRLTAVPDLVWG